MRIIGIDPGVKAGFAQWNPDKKRFDSVTTLTFWKTIDTIDTLQHLERFLPEPDKMIIYLEDPNINKPTFSHRQTAAKVREKISQNVGSNKRDAQLIHEYCVEKGIKVKLLQPNKKGKVNADYFKKISHWGVQCSQHARDAAMLVLGR